MGRSTPPRVLVIGSLSVGKTSLIHRILNSCFDEQISPTTATTFFSYKSRHPIHPEIHIWDTAGMERYRCLNNIFYREAVAAILVFDLTSRITFEELDQWLSEFVANARPNPSLLLCGNKSDLSDEREVETHEIDAFCRGHRYIHFFEISARTGDGVDRAMQCLLELLPHEEHVVFTGAVPLSESNDEANCC
jgi:small GTP-binding protein